MTNPFYITGNIPDKYFCDREKETMWLTTSVTNGNNVVLISPRRMGKTSLINHSFDRPEIKGIYNTFYIDILPTTSLSEFVYLFSKSIYDRLIPRGKKMVDSFLGFVTSLRGVLGYDTMSGLPTLSITSGNVPDPLLTLDEIFRYLGSANQPCIVTIDEFQQICKYPEKNIEALLRNYIQRTSNCNFIYAGSEWHMMTQMFQDTSRPFYNSATAIDLRAIPIDIYTEFIVRNFRESDKDITEDTARSIYNMLDGNTYSIQRLCNLAFAMTTEGASCDTDNIETALQQILEMNHSFYNERLSLVSAKHKPLLYAIASEGQSRQIMSADFLKSHALGTASSVQNSVRQLIDSGLLTLSVGTYSLSDKFLAIWIRKKIL